MTPDPLMKKMNALLDATNCAHPPQAAIDALRQGFNDYPDLWRVAGNMPRQVRLFTLDHVDMTPAAKESIREATTVIRRELGYHEAPMLERLVIEQIVTCWLRMNLTEYAYTHKLLQGTHTTAVGQYWDRRLSMAQSRYLQACEALARLRRLSQITPVQVNIGAKQVNVAGGVTVGQASEGGGSVRA